MIINDYMESEKASRDSKSKADDIKLYIFFHIFKRKCAMTHGCHLGVLGLDHPNTS